MVIFSVKFVCSNPVLLKSGMHVIHQGILFKMHILGFAGDPLDKNLPANAGDMGLIPGTGRSHMPVGQLSPCTPATEPAHPGACSL